MAEITAIEMFSKLFSLKAFESGKKEYFEASPMNRYLQKLGRVVRAANRSEGET